MKELSTREKAKRYDEALEKARQLCAYPTSKPFISDLQDLFPELKESEDEKIKKVLVDYFKRYKEQEECGIKTFFGIPTDNIIAWLEKQVTPQVKTGIEWVNTIDDACDKRYSEEYAEGEYCHEQSFKWGFQEGVEWLEKQGDNADKVEPKFKVGDWISNGRYIRLIVGINSDWDYYMFKDGTSKRIEYIDKRYHLWTIEDAKDGDVLKEDSCIFIIEKMKSEGTAITHCCLFDDGEFDSVGSTLSFDVNSTYLATKEQRNL